MNLEINTFPPNIGITDENKTKTGIMTKLITKAKTIIIFRVFLCNENRPNIKIKSNRNLFSFQ